jgi:TPR repeat protein
MRISDGIGLAAGLLLGLCSPAGAQASDAMARTPLAAPSMLAPQLVQQPQAAYASIKDALRVGMRDYNAGNKGGAIRAFEFAASQGQPLALWKLGRMYADGDGVARNDVRAFQYFSRLADDNADESPSSPRASLVANAFTSLGTYYLEGIKGTNIKPNAPRAVEMFSYSASYFGDPNAQFNLARLYLDGLGLEKDPRQAARWLNLAAEKGHSPAQALLGQLLVNGDGVPMQRARGLMWLELALQTADARSQAWVKSLHEEAFGGASETDRRTASALSEQFQARRR